MDGSLFDVVFDPNSNLSDLTIQIQMADGTPWQALFELVSDVFMAGCSRYGPSLNFDDILEIKSKMKRCQITCVLDEIVYPEHMPPALPHTLFRKEVLGSFSESFLEVVTPGPRVYRVRFVAEHHVPPGKFLGRCV